MPAPTTLQMALFLNGAEIPNTRFEVSSPGIFGTTAGYTAHTQLNGNATILLAANDVIELRVINNFSALLQGVDTNEVVASLNITKVSSP